MVKFSMVEEATKARDALHCLSIQGQHLPLEVKFAESAQDKYTRLTEKAGEKDSNHTPEPLEEKALDGAAKEEHFDVNAIKFEVSALLWSIFVQQPLLQQQVTWARVPLLQEQCLRHRCQRLSVCAVADAISSSSLPHASHGSHACCVAAQPSANSLCSPTTEPSTALAPSCISQTPVNDPESPQRLPSDLESDDLMQALADYISKMEPPNMMSTMEDTPKEQPLLPSAASSTPPSGCGTLPCWLRDSYAAEKFFQDNGQLLFSCQIRTRAYASKSCMQYFPHRSRPVCLSSVESWCVDKSIRPKPACCKPVLAGGWMLWQTGVFKASARTRVALHVQMLPSKRKQASGLMSPIVSAHHPCNQIRTSTLEIDPLRAQRSLVVEPLC